LTLLALAELQDCEGLETDTVRTLLDAVKVICESLSATPILTR